MQLHRLRPRAARLAAEPDLHVEEYLDREHPLHLINTNDCLIIVARARVSPSFQLRSRYLMRNSVSQRKRFDGNAF